MSSKIRTQILLLLFIFSITLSVNAAQPPRVALVLGGGAARGFSHIGLIQAFEEHGVPIDMLVGTSMGSIVSSLYAAGYSVDNMKTIIANLDTASLIDVTFPPKGGLINTTRLQRYLDTLLTHKSFDQLGIPFYSVITELVSGTEKAVHEGSVAVAVQASMSIPALFQPVSIDGLYYVDGGMKNAVPVNVAEELGADVIIGVDVKKELETINYDSILNNLQLTMWFMIDGYVELNTQDADVIIVPEVKYDSYMDYQKAEFFIEQGYAAGLKYMDQIKAAVLQHDPSFEFVPYSQPGYSDAELAAVLKKAEQAAADTPRPFAVMPQLDWIGREDQKFKLGFRLQNGGLGWFNFGYRRGFPLKSSSHEFFVGWHKPNIAQGELFVRPDAKTQIGFKAALPLGEQAQLTAAYQINGDYLWQVRLAHAGLISTNRWNLSSAQTLTMPNGQSGMIGELESLLKFYPTPEHYPLMEVTLVRPYLFGGVAVETPLKQWELSADYQVGVGSEFQLFGLYPLDLYLGLEFAAGSESIWRLGLRREGF